MNFTHIARHPSPWRGSPSQHADPVEVDRLPASIDQHGHREGHGGFSRRHRQHEDDEGVPRERLGALLERATEAREREKKQDEIGQQQTELAAEQPELQQRIEGMLSRDPEDFVIPEDKATIIGENVDVP